PRVLRIALDLFPQIVHMGIDNTIRDEYIFSPDRFVELIDRHDLSTTRQQRAQQLYFERRDFDWTAVFPNFASSEIDLQFAEFVDFRCLCRTHGAAAQRGFDS